MRSNPLPFLCPRPNDVLPPEPIVPGNFLLQEDNSFLLTENDDFIEIE